MNHPEFLDETRIRDILCLGDSILLYFLVILCVEMDFLIVFLVLVECFGDF